MEQLKKTQRCLLHVDNRQKHRTGWRSWESCFITLTNIKHKHSWQLWRPLSLLSLLQTENPTETNQNSVYDPLHKLLDVINLRFPLASFLSPPQLSLLQLLMDGLLYLINKVRELRPEGSSCSRNKAAEPFTVESQRPSRVSVTAWSGKVMSPPSNAGSRPQHPKLISWIWLCPSTFLCFYRSFPRPNLGSLFSCFGTYSMFHLCSLSSHGGMLGNSQAYLDHSAETGRERIQAG